MKTVNSELKAFLLRRRESYQSTIDDCIAKIHEDGFYYCVNWSRHVAGASADKLARTIDWIVKKDEVESEFLHQLEDALHRAIHPEQSSSMSRESVNFINCEVYRELESMSKTLEYIRKDVEEAEDGK
jgi:hypothetical protein